ncbi:hypothetical protein BV898_19233 [Hypsibius exemplaris]|uniref:Uncharacterized protein n=1 Tax=Hypsibius exemplaris TaxID=2072580 RepID=A0A9X6NIK3_HYPEX|nr:hypothetical protein BV898_19233 [Hypsibius exemplaris]
MLMIIMVPETPHHQSSGMSVSEQETDCGSLDLSKYTQREKVADKPCSSESHLRSFCMKKASIIFSGHSVQGNCSIRHSHQVLLGKHGLGSFKLFPRPEP